MSVLPSAAILVLNYNGRQHLASCLPSLAALDYPNHSVVVIDNGSTDGSLEYVRQAHPDVTLLPLGANRGFAPAYNIAVRQSPADVVVLLNNDTRVEPGWLSALMATLDRTGAAAAASTMLDWEGQRIDFVGGLPTFQGHAWQVDHGLPVGRAYTERPLLFGCAGSLAVRREAFLQVGGFDDDFFVYFEDLDLGWRMSLAGLPTMLSPAAITYHRLHGTAAGWGHTLRLRLYERNALFAVIKNFGDEAAARVVPAAIALTLARALATEGLDRDAVRFGKTAPERLPLPPTVVATLLALEDVARALPRLAEKRAAVQASRRVSDQDLFQLFPEPLKLHDVGGAYREAAEALIRDLGIDALFGLAPSRTDARPERRDVSPGDDGDAPTVSVVVLTASGATHLPACLDSLRAHTWPAARTEVIVVDNGSADDPTSVAERHYPGVRVVRTGANLGFSGGNNAGARVATGDWLVFLNDDTRVEPAWLDELMAVATRRQAASVAAFVTDWDGERVDFAGGLVNCEGRGFSLGYDLPAAEADLTERPLLFGCGAAVMFRRDVFEASGGWDEPTFAYYEDVEFGWRLWMLGHEVWFAPHARVRHKHHGTSGTESPARIRAFERNALRMLYALLDDEHLARVLPAALLLAADRALLGTPFSRAHDNTGGTRQALAERLHPRVLKIRLLHALSRRGARRQYGVLTNLRRVGPRGVAGALRDVVREVARGWESPGARAAYLIERITPSAALEAHVEWLPAAIVAQLLGIDDFLRMLPELSKRRARLQAMRRRSDAEILERFGAYWLNAVPSPHLHLHIELREKVLRILEIS
jgi:GT2 family glycosyltransferase